MPNYLKDTRPAIFNQIVIKDYGFSIDKLTTGSGRKVTFKCDKGHIWEAVIKDRTKKGVNCNCPYCSGKRIWGKPNDFASIHPELAKQWDNDKNNCLSSEITHSSNQKFWWKCSEGHSWQQTPNSRTSADPKKGCPYCANRKVLKGYNDLTTRFPSIAKQWHPTKNKLKPDEVVFWQSSNGLLEM